MSETTLDIQDSIWQLLVELSIVLQKTPIWLPEEKLIWELAELIGEPAGMVREALSDLISQKEVLCRITDESITLSIQRGRATLLQRPLLAWNEEERRERARALAAKLGLVRGSL